VQFSSSTLPANDSPLRDRLDHATASGVWTRHRALILLLALASILRLALVVQGGQLYWPDERLYTQVLDIFDLNQASRFAAIKALLGTQDHLGFALISAAPASLQLALGHALSRSGNGLMILPGVLLSQVSVVSIVLVYAIVARRAGRDRVEALIAAALMASATTMFYYARHLLPYDSAMALGLLALWCGLGTSRRDSLLCGAAASAALITYNGYWLLVGVVLLTHIVHEGRTSMKSALMRAVLAGAGFLLVPLAIMAAELATGAPLLISGMRRLAGTVNDGYAPEGFSVTWAYLWHAEHGLLLVWVAAALFVAIDRGEWNSRRYHTATVWVVSAVFIYLGLALSSAVLHVFVVMGRQSRQLVPFFCLATAAVIAELLERRRWHGWILGVCVAALVLQVGWNFRQPLQQRFPRDLIAEITAKYGPIDFDSSIEGPPPANAHVESEWVLLNAQHLYHPRAPRPPLPAGIIEVMRFPHPLQFLPYQYEGFQPMERQVLRSNDISMRLIDIGPPVDTLP
jgi:hypothetical protein